jgi:hypothetical protein
MRFMIRLWQKPAPRPSSNVRFAEQRFFRGLTADGWALGNETLQPQLREPQK